MIQAVALERARTALRELEAVQAELRAGRPQLAKMKLDRVVVSIRQQISEAEILIRRGR
jgi:hypothetical protein